MTAIPTTQQILDQLNAYAEAHADADPMDGHDIWQDLIMAADWYDDAATDRIDQGTNDRLVTTSGAVISWDYQYGEWTEE